MEKNSNTLQEQDVKEAPNLLNIPDLVREEIYKKLNCIDLFTLSLCCQLLKGDVSLFITRLNLARKEIRIVCMDRIYLTFIGPETDRFQIRLFNTFQNDDQLRQPLNYLMTIKDFARDLSLEWPVEGHGFMFYIKQMMSVFHTDICDVLICTIGSKYSVHETGTRRFLSALSDIELRTVHIQTDFPQDAIFMMNNVKKCETLFFGVANRDIRSMFQSMYNSLNNSNGNTKLNEETESFERLVMSRCYNLEFFQFELNVVNEFLKYCIAKGRPTSHVFEFDYGSNNRIEVDREIVLRGLNVRPTTKTGNASIQKIIKRHQWTEMEGNDFDLEGKTEATIWIGRLIDEEDCVRMVVQFW
ncbi:unnamed protein product [Caenorhabditis brenneri]